jgi:hypothetical protein
LLAASLHAQACAGESRSQAQRFVFVCPATCGQLRFYPGFLTADRNVPAGEAVAATRGFGKTLNLPLT